MSIYDRLAFNSSDPLTAATVTPYTTSVNNQMAMVPPLLKTWQQQDIATSNTGGYFVNPVATVAQNIITSANTLSNTISTLNVTGSSSTINAAILSISTLANTAVSAGATFIYTTNRQSNVVGIGTDTTTPHYTTAIGIGKMLSYIVNQSDNVQNNSPIMGSFSSVTIGNTLNSMYSTLSTLSTIFLTSISMANTSNISLSNAQALQTNMSQISTILTQYPAQDKQFFNNSQSVVADFNLVNQFSHTGQSENLLFNQYIGTPKLLSRINT